MPDLVADFERAIRDGLDEGLWDGRREAIRESSGPYSQAQLDAMDNPYAKRHGAPQLDPGRINAQRGVFRDSWSWPEVMRFGEDFSGRLVNDSDVADFLRLGTSTMFNRPIEEETESYVAEAAERRIERALRKWAAQTY